MSDGNCPSTPNSRVRIRHGRIVRPTMCDVTTIRPGLFDSICPIDGGVASRRALAATRRSRLPRSARRRPAGRRMFVRRTRGVALPWSHRRRSAPNRRETCDSRACRRERCRRAHTRRRPARTGTRSKKMRAPTLLAATIFRRWPRRPKPVTSVSACAPHRANSSPATRLSVVMTRMASSIAPSLSSPFLAAVVMMPRPSGLVRISTSPGLRLVVRQDAVRRDLADDGEAEDRLFRFDRVPADDGDAGFGRLVGRALENFDQHFGRQQSVGKTDDAQRRQRRAAHRVHVAQGVRGRDGAKVVRAIDDRREEIGRENEGQVVGQFVDGRIVGRGAADQHVRVGDFGGSEPSSDSK